MYHRRIDFDLTKPLSHRIPLFLIHSLSSSRTDTTEISDGSTFISDTLDVSGAQVEILTGRERREIHHSGLVAQSLDSEIRVRLSGFADGSQVLNYEVFVLEVMPVSLQSQCPAGMYFSRAGEECRRCHPACGTCTGPSVHECQSCRSDFVHDGRTCYEASCPPNLALDAVSATCWRPSGPFTSVVLDFANFPLQQGFSYEVRVRAFNVLNGVRMANSSAPVTASVAVDTTPTQLFPLSVSTMWTPDGLTVDWSKAVREDVDDSIAQVQVLAGLGSSAKLGTMDVVPWSAPLSYPASTTFTFRHEHYHLDSNLEYRIGLRAVNSAGFETTITVAVLP